MIDQGIKELLTADTGVSALVGARIFAGDAPDDMSQLPCVAYSFIGGPASPTLRTSGTIRQRVEIDCFAYAASGGLTPGSVAAAIRAAVTKAMDGWSASLADGTHVLSTTVANSGADFVSVQRIFRCMVEFYVLYTNPSA